MSISEQIKELRTIANNLTIGHNMPISLAIERFREAADTIESLYAKLQAENVENSETDCKIDRNENQQGIKAGTERAERRYTVSKDAKSGLWYAHMKGFSYIPISGSLSENKSDAMEYAKMYDNLPHKVNQIEERRKREFKEYLD